MLCGRCGRKVYHAECKSAGNKCYHFFCFSCYRCRKLLDSCSVNTCGGELYCNACYKCFCNPCNHLEERPLKVCRNKKRRGCPCPDGCCTSDGCCGAKSECCQRRCPSYSGNCCDPCDICCRPLRCVPCPDPCCSCCGRVPNDCCPPEPDSYCLRRTIPAKKCNPQYICLDDCEEPTCMGRSRSCSPCSTKPCCSAKPCCRKQCNRCNPQPCCQKPCGNPQPCCPNPCVNPQPCCQRSCCVQQPCCQKSCCQKPCFSKPPCRTPCSFRCNSPPRCCEQSCTACAAPAPRELAGYYSRNHEKCCNDNICKGKCYCPDGCCCSNKNGCPCLGCCAESNDCSGCCTPYCPPPRKPICYPPRKCCEDPCDIPCERICYYPCKTPCHPKCCSCGLPNPCSCDPNIRRQIAIEINTPCCRRCGCKVYPAEKIMSSYGPYHTCCFSCYCCHKFLEVTNVFETHGEIYCKKCCTKYFGPQGYGYGSTLQSNL